MPEDVIIPLKRTPLWSGNLSLLSAVAAAFTVNTLVDVGPKLWSGGRLDAEAVFSLGIMAAAVALVVGSVARRAFARRRPLFPIRLGASSMRLPVHPESVRHHEVPYTSIIAVGEGGRPPRRHFFIESHRRIYHLPQEMFVHGAGPELLFVALKAQLQELPQGAQQLAQTEQRRSRALAAMGVRPIVTQALLGINVVFFLNTWLKGALDVPFGLLRWGANAPALVYRGEFYRLAAANFLHGHWLHITMNMLALWYLGSLMERLLGWARFSVLYLTAGAIAMAASAYHAGAVLTVGASGAVFGLLGAFAVISVRLRQSLPMGVRQTPRWWVSMILVNTCIPLLWPVVDSAAHIAGFVTGAALALALIGRQRDVPKPHGMPLQTLACAIMLAYVGALGQAVFCAARTTASQEVRFGKLLLADVRTPASTLNTLAWLWMADPASTKEHLIAAKDACLEAVRRDALVPEYQATLGMVCQRLKDVPCAIDAWRAAMDAAYGAERPHGVISSDSGVPALYAMQYARLLDHAQSLPQPSEVAVAPLRRYRDSFFVSRAAVTTTGPLTLLGEGLGEQAVALALWQPEAGAQTELTLPDDLSRALLDAGVRVARIVTRQAAVEAQGQAAAPLPGTWALWRLPAEALEAEADGPASP